MYLYLRKVIIFMLSDNKVLNSKDKVWPEYTNISNLDYSSVNNTF